MIPNDIIIKAWLEQKRLDIKESQDKIIAEMKKLKIYQSDKELRRVFNIYQAQEFFIDDLLADIALVQNKENKQ